MKTANAARGRKPGRQLTLAGQYLIMQLLIIGVVLTGVIAVSVNQATNNFEKSETRRSLSAAESLASNPLLRALLPDAAPEMGSALPAMAESARSISGLDFVAIADAAGTIITSSYPDEVNSSILTPDSTVTQGRAWRGERVHDGKHELIAHIPVLNEEGKLIGIVGAGQSYPNTAELLREIAPSVLFTLLVCILLGAGGSVLLARKVKHQTRGMEPRDITKLFEHREALLHGVKEGVISVSPNHRITLANDVAIELLRLPEDCVGRTLEELNVAPQVTRALLTQQEEADRQFLIGERVLVFNRMPISRGERDLGSVTTFRDRTELSRLEQELGNTKATSDMLRAQTHEFANQLHAISGLIKLEEYGEVERFIEGVSLSRSQLFDSVSTSIEDPTVAALLIAKASVASERGIQLELNEESRLSRCEDALARDLTTVVGNLTDNAIEAVTQIRDAHIQITIEDTDSQIAITVADNGPGIDDAVIEEIFAQGFSTKDHHAAGGRGFGLALARLVCQRHGGHVMARNDNGALFTATLAK